MPKDCLTLQAKVLVNKATRIAVKAEAEAKAEAKAAIRYDMKA
jgi:hypothetical protein